MALMHHYSPNTHKSEIYFTLKEQQSMTNISRIFHMGNVSYAIIYNYIITKITKTTQILMSFLELATYSSVWS